MTALTERDLRLRQLRISTVLFVLASVAGYLFLGDYVGVITLAALTALLFHGLYDRLARRKGFERRLAMPATLLTILFTVLVPLGLVSAVIFYEVQGLVASLPSTNVFEVEQLRNWTQTTIDKLNDIPVLQSYNLSLDSLQAWLQSSTRTIAATAGGYALQASGNASRLLTNTVLYIFLLALFLARGRQIVALVARLSPLREDITAQYLRRVRAMSFAMVKGTFTIAIVTGAVSALTLYLLGVPYVFIWFLVLTFLSLLPLGSAIVFVPIGLVLMLLGDVWQGVVIVLVQVLIISNIDNVLRPKLTSREAELPAALLILSVFAGVSQFGGLGVIYGPIVMIALYTTFELYARYRTTGIPLKETRS